MVNEYAADVLVVGGGVGGTAAPIQAARRGAKTILVSEFSWLGGMLTSAAVSVPDGNELDRYNLKLLNYTQINLNFSFTVRTRSPLCHPLKKYA